MNQEERMTTLCQTLPYLRDKDGFGLGWDTDVVFEGEPGAQDEHPFPTWARGSSAAMEAVRFVRHVWNEHNRAPSLAFWDEHHREAFMVWARSPWWC